MDSEFAQPLPKVGRSAVVRRWSANASVATLVAGLITFGQWIIVDRPQQDRLTRQGAAALAQADASTLSEQVSFEIETLRAVVTEQRRKGKLQPDAAIALVDALKLKTRAFDERYRRADYAQARATLLRVHEIVLVAVCLKQHFSEACDSIDSKLTA